MNRLEIFIWCPTRDMFIEGITSTYLPDGTALAIFDNETNQLLLCDGLAIDELGLVVKQEAVISPTGQLLVPPILIEGHHVNALAYGKLYDLLTIGLPQKDDHGQYLSLFQRTHLLDLIPGIEWTEISQVGEPPGYIGPYGVKLYDPITVTQRKRIWV